MYAIRSYYDDLLVSYDGAFHSANRSILNKLFTP